MFSLTDNEIKAALPPRELQDLAQEQFSRHLELGGIHGFRHWMKVLENGLLLERAIRLHNRPINVDSNITVMSCWDADRLNLLRVGTKPDPRYLCTKGGRDAQVIAWANERALNMWPEGGFE